MGSGRRARRKTSRPRPRARPPTCSGPASPTTRPNVADSRRVARQGRSAQDGGGPHRGAGRQDGGDDRRPARTAGRAGRSRSWTCTSTPARTTVTIFAAAGVNTQTLEARWATGDATTEQVTPIAFRASDFDLDRPEAKVAGTARVLGDAVADKEGTSWDFKFPPSTCATSATVIHEYRGEAVAINHVEIKDGEKNVLHIPTEADLLSLATNDMLEIAGGDVVTATYIDEVNTTGAVAAAHRQADRDLPQRHHHADRLRLHEGGRTARCTRSARNCSASTRASGS